jgi:hypothetical protein
MKKNVDMEKRDSERLHRLAQIIIVIIYLFFSDRILAQNTCVAPVIVPSLPYSLASGTTCGTVNNYTAASVPAGGSTAYLGGEDRVYQFTPTASGTVTISVTQPTGAWLGMFVYTGCPFTAYVGGIQNNTATKSAVITVTAGVTYYVVLDTWPAPTCTAFTAFSISAVTAPYNPCLTIPAISACGISTTATIASGTGAYNPVATTCGFATPGRELIYSFTPTVTGVYSINQTSSFGYIDYFFKPASGGCSGTGWSCIDDLSGAMTSVNFTLTAGITYYIMLDPESTTGGTANFSINCPSLYNPCTSISTIAICGTTINATIGSGNGAYDPVVTTCGFSTPGRELIYSFTPSVSGNYQINQSSSFGWVDYFFKPVSTGCNNSGWTCIQDLFGASVSGSFYLAAGTSYYIMLDPESVVGGTVSFSINCPSAPPANDNCSNAIAVAMPFTSGLTSNIGATSDVPPVSSCGSQANNVWYKIVGNGFNVTATTCFTETNFDSEIRVYNGVCGAMTELTCNDDDGSCTASATNSTVTFCANPGVEYYLSIGYWVDGTTTGNFKISIIESTSCSVLPVELISFDAELIEDEVRLFWKTASEINNDYFTIEKSKDAINYELLANIGGAGNSNVPVQYATIDDNPFYGISYYRLTQTDFNGTKEIFGPIVVHNDQSQVIPPLYFDLMGNQIQPNNVATGI